MEEKKQYPFRYNEEMEALLDKGLEMYKDQSPTLKFSLNQLLDLCVKIAVVIFPKRVQDLTNEVNQLKKQIVKIESEKEKATNKLDELKSAINAKYQIENKIQKLI